MTAAEKSHSLIDLRIVIGQFSCGVAVGSHKHGATREMTASVHRLSNQGKLVCKSVTMASDWSLSCCALQRRSTIGRNSFLVLVQIE